MTLSELEDEILITVKDNSSYVVGNLPTFINEAMVAITDDVEIPELKSISSVTTVVDQAWVNMPPGFDGRLLYAGNAEGEISIEPGGVRELLRIYPGLAEVGKIESVALEGTVLYYHKIPETPTAITVLLYSRPTPLSLQNPTVPAYIPLHLQRGLIAHRTAAIIFDKIEDALEGEKSNMLSQLSMYEKYKNDFRSHVASRRRSHANSVWRT